MGEDFGSHLFDPALESPHHQRPRRHRPMVLWGRCGVFPGHPTCCFPNLVTVQLVGATQCDGKGRQDDGSPTKSVTD